MAGRIRTVKPEVLDDEVASALSDTAWRLWVSAWVLADDDGRFRAGTRLLAADVWKDTGRQVDALTALVELASVGFVEVYELDGQRYARIKPKGWQAHQKISRPSPPRLPSPSDSAVLRLTSQDLSGELRRIQEESGGLRRNRERSGGFLPRARAPSSTTTTTTTTTSARREPQEALLLPEASEPPRLPAVAVPASPVSKADPVDPKGTRVPDDFTETVDDRVYELGREHGFDRAYVDAEAVNFVDYWKGIPGKDGRKADWPATFRRRLRDLAKWDAEKGNAREPLPPERPRKPPAPPKTHDQIQAELGDLLVGARANTPPEVSR